MSICDLNIFDNWRYLGELIEDWHDDEIDETGLATGDVGGVPVAKHGDVKALGLFHITLVEEFFEQKISPLSTGIELTKGGTDVAGMKDGVGNDLLAVLNGLGVSGIDKVLRVRSILDLELLHVIGKFAPDIFHFGHVSMNNYINYSFFK
jgi:hypothetical protein